MSSIVLRSRPAAATTASPGRGKAQPRITALSCSIRTGTISRPARADFSRAREHSLQALEICVTGCDIGTIGRKPHVTQHFERAQQHRQWRSAGGDALETRRAEPRRRGFNEALHEVVVVLAGNSSVQIAELE